MSSGRNDDGQAVVSPPREDPDQHRRHDVVNADDGPGPAPATDKKTTPSRVRNGPQRLGRRGDPRMHRAVAARLADPGISLLDALRAGGFNVRARGAGQEDPGSGGDGVTLSQRKNQLSRRLRQERNRVNHVGAGVGSGGVAAIAPRGVGVGGSRKETGRPNHPTKRESSSVTEGEAWKGSGKSTNASFSSAIPSSLSPPMRPLARNDDGDEVAKSTDPPVKTITGQKRPLSQLKGGEDEVRGERRPPPPTEDGPLRRRLGMPSSLSGTAREVAASFKGGRMGYFNLGDFGGVGTARTPTAMMNAQRLLHQAPVLGTGSGASTSASLLGLALRNPYPATEAGRGGVSKSTTATVNQANLTPEEGAYVNLLRQQHELQDQLLRAHLAKRHQEAIEMGLSPMLATPSATSVFRANAQLESMLQARVQEQAQAHAQLGSRDMNINMRALNVSQALSHDAAVLGSDSAEVSTLIKGSGDNSVLPPSSSSKLGMQRKFASSGGTASGKQDVGSSSMPSSLAGGRATGAMMEPKDVKAPSSSSAGSHVTAVETEKVKAPSSPIARVKATGAETMPTDDKSTSFGGPTAGEVPGGSATPTIVADAGRSIPADNDDASPSFDAGTGGQIAANGRLPFTRTSESRGNVTGSGNDEKRTDRSERMQQALGRYLAENTSLLKRCMIEHGGFDIEETEECSQSYLEFATMASEAEWQRVSRLRRALLLGAGDGSRSGGDNDGEDVNGFMSSSSVRYQQPGGVDASTGGEPRRRGRHHCDHHSRQGLNCSPTTSGNLIEDENSALDRTGSGVGKEGNCESSRCRSLSLQTSDSSSSCCSGGGVPGKVGGKGDAPSKGCKNNNKSQACFNGRHIHRLMGKCGHRAIIHRPKDGPAHVDFVVDGKVECYQDAKPIDGGTSGGSEVRALWPSRYNCEQLQCRTGDDDPTHEVKCLQDGSCSNSCDNIVQNLEPKEIEMSSLKLDDNEWNVEFFNNGSGDETLLGMIRLGGDD